MALSVLGLSASAFSSMIYIVKNGDTISGLSARLIPGRLWGKGGSVEQAVALNPEIKNPNLIFPGQKILLPGKEPIAQKNEERKPADREDNSPLPENTLALPLKIETAQALEISKPTLIPIAKPTLIPKEDGSGTSLELTPFLGMTTLTSKDLASGAQDSLASSLDAGVEARFIQTWNSTFKTFERGRLTYVSFSQPANSGVTLDSTTKLLTTLGFGASEALSSRLSLSESFDLDQNLFIRAASSTSVTTDSVLIPTFGAKISYDLVQKSAFILSLTVDYAEKMSASNNAYNVGLGQQYGGGVEVRARKHGEDLFAVDLGTAYSSQDTNLTTQQETTYTLSVRLFFPDTKPNGMDHEK